MSSTYSEYRKMLYALQTEGYKFSGYHEALEPPCCLLRHDVDMDLEKAVELAEIEEELQIKATYCVMVRGEAYNVFSRRNTDLLLSILEMRHYLGLHFDCSVYPAGSTEQELADFCRREIQYLSSLTGSDVRLISYHKPNSLVLSGAEEISNPLPHAYMRKFMNPGTYFADSYGFWRYGSPLNSEAFKAKRSLILNVHPIWWNEEALSPLYSLRLFMKKRKAETRNYMLNDIVGV